MKLLGAFLAVICFSSSGQSMEKKGVFNKDSIEEAAFYEGDLGCGKREVYSKQKKWMKAQKSDSGFFGKFNQTVYLNKIWPTAEDLTKECCECCDKAKDQKWDKDVTVLTKCNEERIKEIVAKGVEMDRAKSGAATLDFNVAVTLTLATVLGGRDNTNAKVTAFLLVFCWISGSSAQQRENLFPPLSAGWQSHENARIACGNPKSFEDTKRDVEKGDERSFQAPLPSKNDWITKILPTAEYLVKECCDGKEFSKCDDAKVKQIIQSRLGSSATFSTNNVASTSKQNGIAALLGVAAIKFF